MGEPGPGPMIMAWKHERNGKRREMVSVSLWIRWIWLLGIVERIRWVRLDER